MEQQETAVRPLPAVLRDRLDEIAAICRQYGVRYLYVFGSAVHGTFDPATSDLDFMVDLGEYEPEIARRYACLYMALQKLFDREIDLITTKSRGNDRFMEEVTATREMIYAT